MLTLAAIYRERRDWLKARQLLGRAAAAVAGPRRAGAPADRGGGDLRHTSSTTRTRPRRSTPTRCRWIRRASIWSTSWRRSAFAAASGRSLLPLAERLVADRRRRSGSPTSRPRRRRGSGISWRAPPRRRAISTRAAEAYTEALGGAARGAADAGAAARSGGADVPAGAMARGGGGATRRCWRATAASSSARRSWRRWSGSASRTCAAGEPAKAIEPLEKALTLEPRRRVVLEALVEAARAAGDDDAVVRHTQALLSVTEDREKKRELLEHVADDPSRAAQGSAARDRGVHGGAGDLARRAVDHAPPARAAERDQAVEAVGRAADQAGGADRAGVPRAVLRRRGQHPVRGDERRRRGGRRLRARARRRPERPEDVRARRHAGDRARATGRRRSGPTAGRSSAWADGRAAREAARRCWRSGTGWGRSTGRGSRTTRRRSPRSRSRPGWIPNRTSAARSSPSCIA